jgi:hypothetical protein
VKAREVITEAGHWRQIVEVALDTFHSALSLLILFAISRAGNVAKIKIFVLLQGRKKVLVSPVNSGVD